MNTKFVVAVLFALVSVSLCDVAPPSPELVAKYDEYKATFYRRLLNLYNRLQEGAAPLVESAATNERVQVFKDFVEDLQSKPEFQAAVNVASGLGAEVGPLVDSARTSALGAYEQHLRPQIGEQLSNLINDIKGYLDKVMPAE
uniref:Apolipoprotein A-II n=1 Tax=Salarias fasciatus TaxID=181472 RepID=A0A672FJ32_SALFA